MWRAALAALIASTGLAAAQDTALDSLDRRGDALGFGAVGRLEFGGGFCTGVLIESDLVLTAGHCIATAGRLRAATEVTFRAGYLAGRETGRGQAAALAVHPIFLTTRDRATMLSHDVGLVRLAQAIPSTRAQPFAVAGLPDARTPLSVVSYAKGRAEAPSWQRRCTALGRADGLLAMSCDIDFGSSGAPVFAPGPYRPRVVSLVSAKSVWDGQKIALGMDLAPLVQTVKRALRKNATTGQVTGGGAKFLRP